MPHPVCFDLAARAKVTHSMLYCVNLTSRESRAEDCLPYPRRSSSERAGVRPCRPRPAGHPSHHQRRLTVIGEADGLAGWVSFTPRPVDLGGSTEAGEEVLEGSGARLDLLRSLYRSIR